MTYLTKSLKPARVPEAKTRLARSANRHRPSVQALGAVADGGLQRDHYSYAQIPNFPQSTVEGHSGRIVADCSTEFQSQSSRAVFNFYEGYSPQQVTFPHASTGRAWHSRQSFSPTPLEASPKTTA